MATPTGRDWRAIIFRFALLPLAIVGALLPLSIPALFGPWIQAGTDQPPDLYHPEIHRFHDAEFGLVNVILIASLLVSLLWRPRQRPAAVQFVAVAFLANAIAGGYLLLRGGDPESFGGLISLVALLVLVGTYPAPRQLLRWPTGPASMPLLALTVLAALGLGLDVAQNLRLEASGAGGEHFAYGHWVQAVVMDVLLVIGGLFATFGARGGRSVGVAVGLGFVYLGIASLSLPDATGSWGMTGGAASLLLGIAFLGALVWDGRAVSQRCRPATPLLRTLSERS